MHEQKERGTIYKFQIISTYIWDDYVCDDVMYFHINYLFTCMAGIVVVHSLVLVRTMILKTPLTKTIVKPVPSSCSAPLEKMKVFSFTALQRALNDIVRPVGEIWK